MLWRLREYLSDVVVIGGWVPHLYRRYGGFATWTLDMPLTAEVDFLVKPELSAARVRNRLGAYAVNKAVTFPYRSQRAGETGNPKRAKDLLYLRDLMAAGDEVVDRIEQDS